MYGFRRVVFHQTFRSGLVGNCLFSTALKAYVDYFVVYPQVPGLVIASYSHCWRFALFGEWFIVFVVGALL